MAKNETKLSPAFVKQLKGMGFNCKTEEDARAKLLAALEKEGVDGMEDETLQTLIDMVDGFRDTVEVDDEVEDDEIEEVDDEEEGEETDDVNSLADEVEDEEAELEEEKKEEKASEKETTKIEAEKVTPEKKIKKKSSRRVDPKNNAEDKKLIVGVFGGLFPESEYFYAPIANGVSVKFVGKNSKRVIFTFDNIRRGENEIVGNLYLNTMTKETDKLDELGIEYALCWTNAPFLKAVTIEEARETLEKVLDTITAFVKRVDKRLGANFEKMEANLGKSVKKS